ncbi:uncharacterized protein LOC113359574 [Papaver somniferum]|uniref:uncharacterized protein LOC113359574 n=1 Tax=Papaver somniferum TaxID=3469 RepID=UPI000E6F5B7B|nr:uncharacterized protein LOC113359574 [Papaver somniferum]
MDSSVVYLSNSLVEVTSIDLVNNTEERCDAWKFSLIGRLDLSRLKFSDVTVSLKNQWKLKGQCKMIPLGKGFFTIKLDSEIDKMTIKSGKWEVYNQVLWIRNWIPDFRPENHRTSAAMIWVHLPGLSLEYWDEKTLFTICRALGTPVKVDEATLNYDNGYYARVLVNIYFANKIPNKLWIKTKFGGFMHNVILIKPPKFCDHCKIVGHLNMECRVKNFSPQEVTKPTVNLTPKSTTHSQGIKFDISDTLFCSGNQHKGYVSNSKEADNCETPLMQFQSVGVGHQVNPVDISAEDSAVEKSVINFINGKDGSMSEERVPTTSWSKIIQKPSTSKTKPAPLQQKEVIAKNKAQQVNNKYNFRKNQGKGVVFIAEPKISCNATFCNKLNLPGMQIMVIHNSVLNKKGNIWLFWNKHLPTPTVISMSTQMITVNIGGNLISGIHAHVGEVQRRNLWAKMEVISKLNLPWLAIGDFNAFLTAEEKSGGITPNTRNMLEFNNCLDKCDLMQASKSGCEYSWSNCQHGAKRILCNLDKAVINNLWIQKYEGWSYKVGLRIASDHSPLLRGCVRCPKPKNVPQKFQKIWIEHPNFMEVVKKCWSEQVQGDPTFVFQSKLKKLKRVLVD